MTENEAIEILKTDSCDGCMHAANSPIACEYGACRVAEATRIAIKALEDVQQYRNIEKDLKERYHANVDIPLLMRHFIETVFEGEKHEGFCLLTNEDREAWEKYKRIGTPEECRAAMEKQTAKKPEFVDTRFMHNGKHISDGCQLQKCYKCPNCNQHIFHVWDDELYCKYCGQHIDWSDEV